MPWYRLRSFDFRDAIAVGCVVAFVVGLGDAQGLIAAGLFAVAYALLCRGSR